MPNAQWGSTMCSMFHGTFPGEHPVFVMFAINCRALIMKPHFIIRGVFFRPTEKGKFWNRVKNENAAFQAPSFFSLSFVMSKVSRKRQKPVDKNEEWIFNYCRGQWKKVQLLIKRRSGSILKAFNLTVCPHGAISRIRSFFIPIFTLSRVHEDTIKSHLQTTVHCRTSSEFGARTRSWTIVFRIKSSLAAATARNSIASNTDASSSVTTPRILRITPARVYSIPMKLWKWESEGLRPNEINICSSSERSTSEWKRGEIGLDCNFFPRGFIPLVVAARS